MHWASFTSMRPRCVRQSPVPAAGARVACFAIRLATLLACSACAVSFPDYPEGSLTSSSSGAGGGFSGVTVADKVDLLLLVDNSSAMADKQQLLAATIPDLFRGLINPRCIDDSGGAQTPPVDSPTKACAAGFHRQFRPLTDINLGIVTSSLGAIGANQCASDSMSNRDDRGRLVSRLSAPAGAGAPTYMDKGFLAWDPGSTRGGETAPTAIEETLHDMVVGTGQLGCGYEMQLEALYRFLVDPAPYATIEKDNPSDPYSLSNTSGVDDIVLAQRAAFLRPDSLVAIVMLTDEDDCSVIAGGQGYSLLNAAPFFRSAAVCETDPGNKCCYSCGLATPQGCAVDPNCDVNGGKYTMAEDSVNLRCWHQRQRYGVDFLYPVARYVNALSSPTLDPSAVDLVVGPNSSGEPNPLFQDLSGAGAATRNKELVFFTAIAGVPWQAVASDPGNPGSDILDTAGLEGAGFFEAYVGDPDTYVEPTNPIMREHYQNRGVGPSEPNGGDWTISTQDQLQSACIFPLETPVNPGPMCKAGTDNPACSGTTQLSAIATPGLRPLAVVHGLGTRGVAASVCPPSIDAGDAGFAYRPAVRALITRIAPHLAPDSP